MSIQEIIDDRLAGEYGKVTELAGQEPRALFVARDNQAIYQFSRLSAEAKQRLRLAGYGYGRWFTQSNNRIILGWH